MVGVMFLPEAKPVNVLAGLSPSLASFIQQLPPSNGSALDMDMLIETFNKDVPCFKLERLSTPELDEGKADEARGIKNVQSKTSLILRASSVLPSSSSAVDNFLSLKKGTSLLRPSNAGQGCGYLMKSSYFQSNIADPTLKLHESNEAHMVNTSSSLASFIHELPIVNGPSPNVDKVISALLHGDISFRKNGLPSTSRRANSSTMKSFQTSHPLKRKRDDDDKEEVIHKKPSMDIFKLRQIRKLKLQAMAANQNQSGTTSSRTTANQSGTTSSRTTSGTTSSRTSSAHS